MCFSSKCYHTWCKNTIRKSVNDLVLVIKHSFLYTKTSSFFATWRFLLEIPLLVLKMIILDNVENIRLRLSLRLKSVNKHQSVAGDQNICQIVSMRGWTGLCFIQNILFLFVGTSVSFLFLFPHVRPVSTFV